MRRVMVIGAGGGIGLALVDALASRADAELITAIHRRSVTTTCAKVNWVQAGLEDTDAITCTARDMVRQGGLDGIIIATGLLHDDNTRPEKSLSALTESSLLNTYLANAARPMLLLGALKPLLKQANLAYICVLSAQVGSIADNRLGGWYGYRMSKAALNMGIKSAAIELSRERIATRLLAIHPGTTRTGLSAPFIQRRRAPVATPEESAVQILELLEGATDLENGAFLCANGTPLPW